MTVIPIVIGALDTVTKGLLKGMEDSEIRGQVETIQTTSVLLRFEIVQDTKKSPEDSRRLAVTQIPMIDHRQTLM